MLDKKLTPVRPKLDDSKKDLDPIDN
jgi:hypothetical protein